MVKIRKYANSIERFLHGRNGQRFFNFAYSIGAAIVIWGALFKILHLPGGSLLLCIGMGTEIAMFILTAFDRPPKEYHWEEVFPELDPDNETTDPPANRHSIAAHNGSTSSQAITGHPKSVITNADFVENSAAIAAESGEWAGALKSLALQIDQLQQSTRELNSVSSSVLDSYKSITDNSGSISENSRGYVEHMEELNRNIAALNTIYELQLKSVAGQIETIDRVNRSMKDIRDMYEKSANESSRYCEETERMARYMRQLNSVYEKMITAMTVNMANPVMGNTAVNPFMQDKPND